jgi:hypothetical protein
MNMMNVEEQVSRYQMCIDASKRVRWDIEEDIIRGRQFNVANKFLPDGLTGMQNADFLSEADQVFVSQIQGRTYTKVFGVAERFVNAKILELSNDHSLSDQTALEALIRFSDEELKHQALFRRVDELCEQVMPVGYSFDADPNVVAQAVLSKSTWAVLALTLHIELFTQSHYRESIDQDPSVSELYRDVFKYHWMEECQHAIIDEMELRRIDATISAAERDVAVDEFIELVGAVDGILQDQARADTAYFARTVDRTVSEGEQENVHDMFLRAYRWQYILSGAEHRRFQKVLGELLTPTQTMRIDTAIATLR